MAGFDVGKARELFSIPAGYEPVAAMPPKAACRSFDSHLVIKEILKICLKDYSKEK